MKERPILFSAPMVRAILEGRKTMTRRVVKPQPGTMLKDGVAPMPYDAYAREEGPGLWAVRHDQAVFRVPGRKEKIEYWREQCPYGQPGDRLWVRETWGVSQGSALDSPNPKWPNLINYREPTYIPGSNCGVGGLVHRWRPSIYMPRWASRILLEVVSVRVERLQDISGDDARSEGVGEQLRPYDCGFELESEQDAMAIKAFAALWESINGKDREKRWNANPWVWLIEFKRVAQCKNPSDGDRGTTDRGR